MRLIDADVYLKRIRPRGIADELWTASEAYLSIMRMPTVDAVPVRHGHWIACGEPDIDGNCTYTCSVCGAGEIHAPEVTVNYCWKCGARMDGKDGGDGSTD